MAKQVKNTHVVEQGSVVQIETPKNSRTLYVRVDTFDIEGKTVGTRIVDMYHFGTNGWMQKHQWWAMHNGHTVETNVANEAEVADYVAYQKQLLAERFNTDRAHIAA